MSDSECEWARKWRDINSFHVACQFGNRMHGIDEVAVPPAGARFCCWCGKSIKFVEPARP